MFRRSIFVAFILMVFAVAVQAQEFATNGLILMYTFDSKGISGATVTDASGKGNNGKIVGSLKTTPGVIGEALKFDGGQNYVEIPKMGSFEKVSVECWAYEEAFSGIQGIVSTWQWTAGKVHFKFESNQIQVDKNGAGKIVAAAEAKKWYHIIYTTDTVGNALKLYVNGKLAAEGPGGAGTKELWDERRVGSEHDGRFLNGMIDEVRVYNRVLSVAEVTQNYAAKSNSFTAVKPAGKATVTWGEIKY